VLPEAEVGTLLSRPFVLMLCAQFFFGLSYSTFFLLPKYLAREMHADARAIGAVASTALLSGVLAVPWIGSALDRGRRRPFITWGALVNAVSACGFASVHSIALPLYALRAVHGISYALVFNATVTLATDLAPARQLGQAIGLCGAAGMVANAIAPAAAEWIADRQGWSLVFWLAAGAALVASACSLGIRERRGSATPAAIAREPAPSALALIRDPKRIGAFLASAVAGAGFGVMFTFTQPFALGRGANQVSGFFVGYTLCALAVRVFLGGLADRVGRARVAFFALALYGLVLCLTSQLRPDLLFAFGACFGLAHGLLYPAINALGAEGVPRSRRGSVMSYFSGCFYGGFALWVLGAGWLARSYGYPLLFLLTGLLLWAALPVLPRQGKRARAT
jgi:MFS family permease